MKRKVFSLMMGLILAFTGLVRADELTVNDGSATNSYIPIYGYYADMSSSYTDAQFILPGSDLAGMNGTAITALTFYANYNQNFGAAVFDIYMQETVSTTMSSLASVTGLTPVYSGNLAIASNQLVITLTNPYEYNGGNLLVTFHKASTGSCSSSSADKFYGVSASNGASGYYSSSRFSGQSFLPKVTFTYLDGPLPVRGLHVVDAEGNVDVINVGPRPSGAWMRPYEFTMTYDGFTPIAVGVLDFTPNDGYFTMVDVEYPINFNNGTEVDLAIATGESEEGLVERKFVAIYEGTREAAVWDITAEAYTPVEPDVWEMARVINDAYPFEYRNTATEGVTLYDNYLLPGNAEDGPDAVYKVTFNQDVMLNGTVTTIGTDEMAENAKMAVYTEDFYEEVYGFGGPDVENNYTGPQIGGGSEPYDVIIGEGTGTSGFQPCYHFYNYSLSQQVYLASMLQEAGMGAGVINTIGYYTESTYGYHMNGIKIWMANVTDATAPSTSVLTSTMTLVYEGSFDQIVGWNDFELNGNFAWDGTSNLLVFFQRNNGAYSSSIQWQYTAQSYTAGAYCYNDGSAYAPESTTYSMTTTTNLPNTHFVGGGREVANRDAEYIIENMTMVPGTYYIAASSTEADWDVVLNADELPCPEPAVVAAPVDDADDLEPAAVNLSWRLGQYATEYRLVFGSTYYCEDVLVDWTTDLAQSYTVRNLYNNTNYFWRVDVRNGNCETLGEVWGFTTHLNVPQNLRVADETIFEGQDAVLSWTAIQDRTYRYYNIYQDGDLIASTPANVVTTTYTVEGLTYNMEGYSFYVTAVYDEGESLPSNEVNVKVSGNGYVAGHVYEQDGTTGIAGATVTFNGTDEFGDAQTFSFITDGTGAYGGEIMAGEFNGMAACTGYQTVTEPTCGNPVEITFDETTSNVDFVMDENFDPVCGVVAQYYPDSLNPASEYVKVYWGCGLPGGEIIEDFETGDFSKFDWQLNANYPWDITTNNPYEGMYCMKSGGAGVANVVSDMSVTVDIPADGVMSFFSKISCESSWDYAYFYIDGVQKGSYTGTGNWGERTFEVTAGEHTFKWSYTKDGSVNSGDDCFYVDYITFYRQPEPPVPGMTYTFDDGTMQGWTTIDADGDGYNWVSSSTPGNYHNAGVDLTGTGHNSSAHYVISGSYANGTGQALNPDNYLVSPQVELGGIVKFYACAQDANYAAEHFGLAVSTTTNTSASAFTTVQEWTMSAKSGQPTGKPVKGSRSGRDQGNWYEYTVDLSAYSGMGYVAIRHFNCSDQFILNVDDITIGEASKGANDRAFSHYRVYRTNCYNDGPYTEENTVVLACELMDTLYIDVEWGDLNPGVYKYGVGVVYSGNRGQEIAGPIHWANVSNSTVDSYANSKGARLEAIQEPRESDIVWSNCLDKDMYLEGDVTINVLLNSADNPEGTTVTFTNLNAGEQELYPIDPIVLDETGFYAFDSFRRGDYNLKIQHEGYYDIEEEVSIWEATDLRYVMTEIIYGIDNLYVSSTGWAMWSGQTPGPVPPTPGDTEFTEGFEGGLNGWNVLNASGDASWIHSDDNLGGYDYTVLAHTGTGFAMGYSFVDYMGAYNIDSYLYTPQKYTITNGSTLTFWADNANDSYPESFSVCVATADNPTAADFTQVWAGSAKAGNAEKAAVRHDANRYENWRQHTIDLSAYAGQDVYIAFHDVNYDMYEIWIDDVQLTAGRNDDRHLEYYKVMCTSIDGQAIFNADTEHPFCQVATDELVEGEHYICKVAAVYSTGMSDWAECEWAYIPCDNYAGTAEGVVEEDNTNGNHFSWTYPVGPGPVPPTPDENAIITLTVGDVWGDGSGYQMLLDPTASLYGSVIPATGALSTNCSGNEGIYNQFAYKIPANADGNCSTQNIVYNNSISIEVPAGTYDWCITNPTPGDRIWIASSNGNVGGRQNDYVFEANKTYEFTVSLGGSNDQVNVTISGGAKNMNAPLACGEVKNFDDVTPVQVDYTVLPANGNREMWDLIGTMSLTSAGQQGVATDGEYIYTCSWQSAPTGGYSFYKYEMDGTFIEGFNINGVSEIRDLTWDGEFFYGGNGTSTLYTFDLANHVLVNTTSTTCSAIRHCSYDAQNDGFWVGNWSDLKLIDRSGATITNGPAPTSAYGSGYFQEEDGTAHLYLFCQPNSDAKVYDYNITTNTLNSTPVCDFSAVPGYNAGISGGAFVGAYNGQIAFFGNMQQDPNLIGIYELSSVPGPVPPTPTGDVLGAMIFRDGEWLAEVAYPTSEYTDTDEFERHEYCVRLIYNGTNTLPEGNIYYSMSCPECKEIGNGETQCAAGADIRGEYQWHEGGEFGALISWGEQVPPIVPVEEWLYYDDGTYAGSVGTGSPSPCYWGIMIPATAMGAYDGCSLTQVALFDAYAATYTCNIYYGGNNPNGGTLVHTQNLTGTGSQDWVYANLTSALPIDATQNLWITFYCNTLEYPMAGSNDTGDANGRWVSLDGSTWEDISGYGLNYTWMIRGFVTNQAKGGSIAALDPFQGGASEGTFQAIAGSSNAQFDFSNRAAQIVKYNVYRSADNNDYDLIGSVNAVAGQDYYEYFDEIAAGAYYYQVTAVYDNDCESDPALAEDNHANNYVIVAVTGVEENEGIALYPNPTSGNVKIEAVGMNHITVVSALGQVVYDVEVSCDEYELNMAQFNAGIYMVRISSESGVSTQRVTVVR